LTADRFFDEKFRNNFIKNFEGLVKLKDGNNFGFVNDVYIHFSLVEKYKLKDGMPFKGQAIMSYNKEKDSFGWKVL
jgi:transcription termination factor Rho